MEQKEMNERFEQIDKRFDKIEIDISGLSSMFKLMIEKLDKMDKKLDRINIKVEKNSWTLKELECRVEDVEAKFATT